MRKPVYWIVTVSPTFGIGPLPSELVVLVTPMIALVAVNARDVEVVKVVVDTRRGRWESCLWKTLNMYASSGRSE